MGSIFGKHENKNANNSKASRPAQPAPASNQVNDKDRAILDLKNARDRLKKFKKKVSESTMLQVI